MKNYLAGFAAAISLLALASCGSKGDQFEISGTINHPGAVKTVFLMAADSAGMSVVDSVPLATDGKFTFKHAAPYPNLYKVRAGATAFDIIADKGDDLTFSTDLSDNRHLYDISGSDESKKIQEFNRVSSKYTAETQKIFDQYQARAQQLGKESDSLANIYRPAFMKNQDEYGQAILKFMADNKNSLAAFFAATSLDQSKYEQQLVAYADELDGKFVGNPSVQRFIKFMAIVKPISIGHKAPEFTANGIDGKPVKLSDYKGKYVMLDFWASWCGPCRAENPNVVKLYSQYNPKGFNILGVSLDVDKGAWKGAIDHDHLVWAHVSDLQRFDGPTEKLYDIMAIPSNFIVDPQGTIVAKNIMGSDLEEFLNKTFNKPQ